MNTEQASAACTLCHGRGEVDSPQAANIIEYWSGLNSGSMYGALRHCDPRYIVCPCCEGTKVLPALSQESQDKINALITQASTPGGGWPQVTLPRDLTPVEEGHLHASTIVYLHKLGFSQNYWVVLRNR